PCQARAGSRDLRDEGPGQRRCRVQGTGRDPSTGGPSRCGALRRTARSGVGRAPRGVADRPTPQPHGVYAVHPYGTPFVMKDRDVVVRITIDVLPEKRAVHVHDQSTAAPLAPLTDYVRGEISDSDFLLTALEPHTTMVLEATMHADPQGAVPKWIVNL